MNEREQQLRHGENEAAQHESNLWVEVAQLEQTAAQLQQQLTQVKAQAAQLKLEGGTPEVVKLAERLSRTQVAHHDLDALRNRILDVRAEALQARAKAADKLLHAVHAWSKDLTQLHQQLFADTATLNEAEERARAAAEASAREAAAARAREAARPRPPVPAPAPTVAPEVAPSYGQRKQPRVQMQAQVAFDSETNFFAGFSTNISDGGLFVATVQHMDLGQEIDLHFTLPSGDRVNAHGVVRWVREINDKTPEIFPGVGIQFVNLAAEAQAAIHKFVASREPLFWPD